MAKDRTNQGGPTVSPKDEPTKDRDNYKAANHAQSESGAESNDENINREGAGESRRSGSESNAGRGRK